MLKKIKVLIYKAAGIEAKINTFLQYFEETFPFHLAIKTKINKTSIKIFNIYIYI